MPSISSTSDLELIEAIKNDDQKAYRALFDRYYKYLVVTAYAYVKEENTSRDLTQDVFFEIWKKRNSLKNFEDSDETFDVPDRAKVQEELEASQLQKVINETIENLPHRCRVIFVMRRMEELSLKEIAAKLDISPKTVENQLTKAIKILRAAVEPYVSGGLFIFLLFGFF